MLPSLSSRQCYSSILYCTLQDVYSLTLSFPLLQVFAVLTVWKSVQKAKHVFLSPRHLLQAMGVTLQVFSERSTSEVHGGISKYSGKVGGGAAQRENQSPPQRQGITRAIIE